jgi:alkylation response protein AidB-like acyl-CoA dehydrogenase
MGVVIADLRVGGESHGPHPFLIQLRDTDTHELRPGVRIDDMGIKTVANDLDNARVWFDNVHLPRDALLNKFCRIRDDGKYEQVGNRPILTFAATTTAAAASTTIIFLSTTTTTITTTAATTATTTIFTTNKHHLVRRPRPHAHSSHHHHQVGDLPMKIEVIGQRLLTGRMVIAQAAVIAARVLHMKTEEYAKGKMCNALAGEAPLASMPQLKAVFAESYAALDEVRHHHMAWLCVCLDQIHGCRDALMQSNGSVFL